jgi:Wnt-binding factor required for Wnt secretion
VVIKNSCHSNENLYIAVPLEYLTLWVEMPFMLLLGDLKQGIFYAMLLSFWLVFAGEHLMVHTCILRFLNGLSALTLWLNASCHSNSRLFHVTRRFSITLSALPVSGIGFGLLSLFAQRRWVSLAQLGTIRPIVFCLSNGFSPSCETLLSLPLG